MAEQNKSEDSIPFYPDHVRTEFRVVLGILVVALTIGIAGMLKPVGIGDPADPLNTPLHVKPEWYFLGLYQSLKFIPKTTGAVAPVVLLLVLTMWPFLDRKPDSSRLAARNRLITAAVAVVVLIALTIWGEVS